MNFFVSKYQKLINFVLLLLFFAIQNIHSQSVTVFREVFPSTFNTGYSGNLNTTFTGNFGTWSVSSNQSYASVAVVSTASFSSPNSLVLRNNSGAAASLASVTSPSFNLSAYTACNTGGNLTFRIDATKLNSNNHSTVYYVDFSSNGGSTWTNVTTITAGNLRSAYPTAWSLATINIPASFITNNFRFRFSATNPANSGYNNDVNIDDVEVQVNACAATPTCSVSGQTNPLAAAMGYNVFARNNTTFQNGHSDGAVAMGGNLILNGSFTTGMANSGYLPAGFNSTSNIALLIGGGVTYTSGGVSYVNSGLIRIGNTIGSKLYYKDCNNASSNLRVVKDQSSTCAVEYNSTPRIESYTQHVEPSPTFATGLNFTDAFTTLQTEANKLSNYNSNATCSSSLNIIQTNSGNNNITLAANKINVINTTGSGLNAITQFTFNNNPSATQPLIINVNQSGSFTWNAPTYAGLLTSASKFIIFNFYNNTGTVTLSGSASIYGSILVPGGSFIKNHNGNIEGQIVAQNITLNGGEVHEQRFEVCLPSCTIQSGSSCTGNLLTNPGFENPNNYLTGWDNWGNTISVSDAYSGIVAAKVLNGSGGFAQSVSGIAGNIYTVRAYAKQINGSEWSGIGIKYYNASWGAISETNVQITTTTYQQYTVTSTAPSGTAFVQVYLWKNTGSAFVYADDFCLTVAEASCNPNDATAANGTAFCALSPNCGTGTNLFWEQKIDVSNGNASIVRLVCGSTTSYTIPSVNYPALLTSGNPVSVNINDVVSYDGYVGRNGVSQGNERWRVVFRKSGATVATTPYTNDVADNVNQASWRGSLGTVNLPNGADEVRIEHWSVANDASCTNGPNSVVPVSVCMTVSAVSTPSPCGQGFVLQNTSLVTNGNFTNTNITPINNSFTGNNTTAGIAYSYTGGSFSAQAQQTTGGSNVYPGSERHFNIQQGIFNNSSYSSFCLVQSPFPGDPTFNVPATNNWMYHNGNDLGGARVVWGQTITGLTVGRKYIFRFYASNVINSGCNYSDPIISAYTGGNVGLPNGTKIINAVALDETATGENAPLKGWIRFSYEFTATSTTQIFKIVDEQTSISGDDLALTAIGIDECAPGPNCVSNAGSNQTQCNNNTFTMAANAPTGSATGAWSVVSGAATFSNINSPTTTVQVTTSNAVIRWTVTDGTCSAFSDVTLTKNPTLTMGDFVWYDINGNGLQDAGEPGIQGITVKLYADNNADNIPDGAALATTTTNASGAYSFTNFCTGRYIITVTLPNGYVNTITTGTSADPNNETPNDNNGVAVYNTNEIRTNSINLIANNIRIDFGLRGTGSIGDFVWHDINGNGIQDTGEPGIQGVTVTLTYPNGFQFTTTTNNAGNYLFSNLIPGTYTVTFSTPTGYNPSPAKVGTNDNIDSDPLNGTVTVTLTAGQNNLNVDAGFVNCVKGTETFPNTYNTGFSKPITNGTFNGSSGTWSVNTSSNATIVVTTPYYSPSTSYAIKIVNWATNGSMPEGPTPGTGTTVVSSPKVDLSSPCCPAELKLQFTLWTYVVNGNDTNTDWFIEYSNDNGTTWNQIYKTTPAALATAYGANAKVNLSFGVPAMYHNANFRYRFRTNKPINNPYNFYIFIDDIIIQSPGTCAPTLSLGDFVWWDVNNNGLQDAGEPGINGATVNLYYDVDGDNIPDGAPIATTTTNASGAYNFANLGNGKYVVAVVTPNGYTQGTTTGTSADPNNATTNDNNGVAVFNTNEIRTNSINLTANNPRVDFGLRGIMNLGDFVWYDVNNNGIQDAGEPGVSGATVNLYVDANGDNIPDGAAIATTTTNASGIYGFANLPPGNYIVGVVLPSGYAQGATTGTSANPNNDNLTDNNGVNLVGNEVRSNFITLTVGGEPTNDGDGSNGNLTLDFGLRGVMNLGNLVWFDANGNGLKDAAETGISGLTVSLYVDANGDNVPDGPAILTTTTNASGIYGFSNLVPNNYIVGVTMPSGYVAAPTTGTSANPNNDIDNDNNGVNTVGSELRSNFITLTVGGEPTNDGDGNNGNLTLDFALRGILNLGNLIWVDKCNYGIKDPTETGFGGAVVNLYEDKNGDNLPDGAAIATTTTNLNGVYVFSNLIPGNYIVGVVLPNRYANSAIVTSSANPNNDIDNDNNGIRTSGGILYSNRITLTVGGEPTNDGDGSNGNLTLDFGIAYDTDSDGIADIIDIDDDNDGITDVNEHGGFDPFGDCDNDCVPNYLDPTPGPGCPPWSDCNSDGINDFYDWDRDGIINSLDLDSDNDGIPDAVEARPNRVAFTSIANGMITGTDADGNGLLSSADNGSGFTNPQLNGLIPSDIDRDGTPNFLDLDSDGDGITDLTEGLGVYSTTGVVTGTDTDGDGVAAENFGSSANNVADNVNGFGARGIVLLDTDGDGYPDAYDIDSDNDGITDNAEGQATCSNKLPLGTDCDGDGVDDAYDVNLCTACLKTSGGITPFDKDGDGTPDYRDLDTDNDGAPDIYEGHRINGATPSANYWTGATGDVDKDGLIDFFDAFNIVSATNNFHRNVVNNNMGDFGVWETGTGPVGSITQLPKSRVPIEVCSNGDRDWRDLTILPSTIIAFKGNLNGTTVKLSWSVTNEVNVKQYEVERSINGNSFIKVGTVNATNTPGILNYAAEDVITNINAPVLYYRLKVVDRNGSSSYSNTIAFKVDNNKPTIVIAPNPANSFFTVKITADKEADAVIKVVDITGRTIVTQKTTVLQGVNTISFNNLSNYSAGTYMVHVITNQNITTEKLVITK